MRTARTISEPTNIGDLNLKNRIIRAPMTRSRAGASDRANRLLSAGGADLVERFRLDAPLTTPDAATFYTPGSRGYTDYPMLGGEAFVGAVAGKSAFAEDMTRGSS